MRPRWHKVFSDLTSHRIRSLLVIASIAVGLFAIGMITTVYVILAEDIRASYEAINPANVQINAALFDDEFVEHIRRMPRLPPPKAPGSPACRSAQPPVSGGLSP